MTLQLTSGFGELESKSLKLREVPPNPLIQNSLQMSKWNSSIHLTSEIGLYIISETITLSE